MEAGAVRVRLEQCAKTFPDGTKALAPLDLEVRAGETVVFLGHYEESVIAHLPVLRSNEQFQAKEETNP